MNSTGSLAGRPSIPQGERVLVEFPSPQPSSVRGGVSNHERRGELGGRPSIPQGERVLVGLPCLGLPSVRGKVSNHERRGELGSRSSIPQGERVLVEPACLSPPPFVVRYRTMNGAGNLQTALRYLRANGLRLWQSPSWETRSAGPDRNASSQISASSCARTAPSCDLRSRTRALRQYRAAGARCPR